ncbi:hypothetical protein Tco_1137321 [Tanacetum coccineum]
MWILLQDSGTDTEPLENIVQLIVFIVDSGCTKHMMGNLKLLCNFVEKYMGSKLVPNVSPPTDTNAPSLQDLDFLFSPLFEENFTVGNQSFSKTSSLSDNSNQQDTQPTTNIQPTTEPTTPTNVNAEENNTNQAVDTQFQQDEFINPFCTPVQEVSKSSSRNLDNSNIHTFYQPHNSEYRWTKDPPLEQVRRNPSKPVQTR